MDFTFHLQWGIKLNSQLPWYFSMEATVSLFTIINPQVHLTAVWFSHTCLVKHEVALREGRKFELGARQLEVAKKL